MSDRRNRVIRQEKNKALIRLGMLALCLFLIGTATFLLGKRAWMAVSSLGRNNIIVQSGHFEQCMNGHAVLLQRECCVFAPDQGHFENTVKEMEKVRRGALVGYYIESDGKRTAMYARQSGIFSMQMDGLEKSLSDFDFKQSAAKVFDYKANSIDYKVIQEDQGIYKIIDNLSRTRLCVKIKKNDQLYEPEIGQQLRISLEEKQEIKACVEALDKKDDNLYVLLSVEEYYPAFSGKRFMNIKIIQDSPEGYIIPEKALAQEGNKKGVFCLKEEKIIFKPVKVIMNQGDQLLVTGLEENDIIVLSRY